jgi:hypothetical protein
VAAHRSTIRRREIEYDVLAGRRPLPLSTRGRSARVIPFRSQVVRVGGIDLIAEASLNN